jgi:hypothetical protein
MEVISREKIVLSLELGPVRNEEKLYRTLFADLPQGNIQINPCPNLAWKREIETERERERVGEGEKESKRDRERERERDGERERRTNDSTMRQT